MTAMWMTKIIAWVGLGFGLLGLAVALWAWRGDRSRGRRRCGRCWYDMQGVPGLRCPECGREAKSERALLRTRRRWRGVVVGLVLVSCGICGAAPRARAKGWASVLPQWALERMLRPIGHEGDPRDPHWATREMARRWKAGELDLEAAADAILAQGAFRTGGEWLRGSTIVAPLNLPDWASWDIGAVVQQEGASGAGSGPHHVFSGRTSIMLLDRPVTSAWEAPQFGGVGVAADGLTSLDLRCEFKSSAGATATRRLRMPIRVVDQLNFVADNSPGATEWVAHALRWERLDAYGTGGKGWVMPVLDRRSEGMFDDLAMVLKLDVDRGEGWRELGVIGRGAEPRQLVGRTPGLVLEIEDLSMGWLKVRVRGEKPEVATTWKHPRWWSGEFEVSLEELRAAAER